MSDWQPIETAPRDGTWILGCNDAGNCAVIIWSFNALRRRRYPIKPDDYGLEQQFDVGEGWIQPFTTGEVSPFWDGGRAKYWMPLPSRPERPQNASVSPKGEVR